MEERGGLTGKQAVQQAQRSSKMLVFAVNHLLCMATAMHQKYYAELEKA